MHAFVKWLQLLALVVWLGEVVFFSFVVAPAIFGAFPAVEAGRAIGAILPTYYQIGYGCGALLLVTTLVRLSRAEARTWLGVNALLVAGMLGATVYAGVLIQPRAAELRPQLHDPAAPPGARDEFDRLHHLAVTLNGVVLVGGVMLSVMAAGAPRS